MRTTPRLHLAALFVLLGVLSPATTFAAPLILAAPHHRWDIGGAPLQSAFEQRLGPVLRGAPFVRLGMRWDGDGSVHWQTRFSQDGERWGAWKTLKRTWSEGLLHVEHIDAPAPRPQFAQLRMIGTGRVLWIVLDLLTVVGEARVQDTGQTTSEDGEIGRSTSALKGPFNPRSAWGARPAKCQDPDPKKSRMAIHHTAGTNNDTMAPAARVRQIQAYHQDTNGWCDIGYHLLVSQDGQAWEGRPSETMGAHAGGANSQNLGISFFGDFTTITPNQKMLCTGAKLIDWGAKIYAIPRNRQTIKGHREYKATACPGDKFFAILGDLINLSTTGCNQEPHTIELPQEPPPKEPVSKEPAPDAKQPDAGQPDTRTPEKPKTVDNHPPDPSRTPEKTAPPKDDLIRLGDSPISCLKETDCPKGSTCQRGKCVVSKGCGCNSTHPLSLSLPFLLLLLCLLFQRRRA